MPGYIFSRDTAAGQGRGARLLAALTAFVVLIGVAGCGGGGTSAGDAAPDGNRPYGIYSPGTLDEVTPGDAQAMIEALGLDSFRAYQDFNLGVVSEIGINWIRYDFEYNGIGFVEQPDYLDKARSAGLEVVGCIRPVVDYAPSALTSFEPNLKVLVQQYSWIKVWQIGNEPNVSPNQTDDFPRFFLTGSRAVREACPDCQVMIAGVASRYPDKTTALDVYDWLLGRIAALSGGQKPFDIFDMHFYGAAGSEEELLANIVDFRRLLDKHGFGSDTPVWLTETATYTGAVVAPGDLQPQTEEQQAAELVQRFVTALGAGLGRVSWSRPYENFRYAGIEDGFYDNTALVYNGLGQESRRGFKAGTKKLAFYAYRTLVAETAGYDKILSMAPGVYQFTFADGRPPVYVVWDEDAGPLPAGLLPDVPGGLRVTDVRGGVAVQAAPEIVPGPLPVFVSEPER